LRLPYWREMLDALAREPWWGYGWQQVGAAQQRVASLYPPLGHGVYFDHSHDIVLDLLLWNGIPIGGLIVLLLGWWFVVHIRACRDARAAWLLAAVGGVVVHGLLEYPLEYAYFLIPVGLAMGAVEGFAPAGGAALRVPRWAALVFTLLLATVSVGVASDYMQAEQNYRIQRFELAHIGTDRVHTPAPHLRLLTQLDAFLQIAHTDPKRGMNPTQIEALRRAALRFGSQPALRRYAVALALNGRPAEAAHQLQILRHIWGEQAYREAKAQMTALAANGYPELRELALP
ncbi:MAG: O-antigen ligase C-terminal domain-containing protein, partial [Proteobacteria bacterium]|nr:O-antigen ligase C-terminal domain-containing protein [Pseudomonadota bacterium]